MIPRLLMPLLLMAVGLVAQEQKVEATWLRRTVSPLQAPAAGSCVYTPIFGQGDTDSRLLRSTTRFGLAVLGAHAGCPTAAYDREEEIDFVLDGKGSLDYSGKTLPLRKNDFTYLAPGSGRTLSNSSDQPMRVLVMTFRIPPKINISAPAPEPKVVNLEDVKEETVGGHPSSVLYRLLVGPRTGKRDAIDQAYVVTSLFWMDFAPGGTNFPHHHETAEEIYLVIEGEGEMVAGSGMDGIEARFPSKAGDAYYFRPNCTVGFYNQNKPGAKGYILAVRSKIPFVEDD
jgi:mannose-6-phosphate isomerase-like protein (cupin superfamily)